MELLRILDEYRTAGGGDCALATVVETNGSTYRRAGARLLIRRDRKTWGAISGGCIESDIVERAVHVIGRGEPSLIRFKPADDDLLFGLGSGCGGELAVFIEPLPESLHRDLLTAGTGSVLITSSSRTWVGAPSDAPADAFVQPIVQRPTLFIFGASPAAEPLLRFAKELGWCVRIADHRPVVATSERFAAADAVEIAPAEELPSRFSYPRPSIAVVMTHHYLRDLELIRQLAPLRLAYLGLVGSRDRAHRLIAEATALGTASDALAVLHAPAGLDLGADAPSEIALSIVSEIQAVLRATTACALRDRAGRVHGELDTPVAAVCA
jgi:xanthine dehydrogenase accessory factor